MNGSNRRLVGKPDHIENHPPKGGHTQKALRFTGSNRRLTGKSKRIKRTNRKTFIHNKELLLNNVVVNHSSAVLSIHEISILNKGLGFVPSHFKPNFQTINDDILRFERKLQLHFHFNKDLDPDCKIIDPVIKKSLEGNSDWWPRVLNPHITHMCYKLKEFIFKSSKEFHSANNLSKPEIQALHSLKSNENIIIKKADKGGGIVVLDKLSYRDQVNTLLADTQTYLLTNLDDTLPVKSEIDKLLYDLHLDNILNQKQFAFLTNFTPRCPRFYGLPKLHKVGFPLRPIVSQIDGPTSRLNLLVDKLLHTAESNIPFLLQDTTAFLQLLSKHKFCKPGTYLVTMDVTSLYTNIPHVEGCKFVCEFYQDTLHLWLEDELRPIDTNLLFNLMMFILEHCTFEFDGVFYKQLFGTTMGASFSVKFANVYMHMWFRKHLALYSGIKPDFIARLIDDCFFLWNESEDDLVLFFEFLNSCHSSIKFDVSYSKEKVHFLDTETYIVDDVIRTTVYTKPSDKKQFLFFTSGHPTHVMRSIPFSQGLRYRRIIDDDTVLEKELGNLANLFALRGYPKPLLNDTFSKVKDITRDSTLLYKDVLSKRASFTRFLKGKSFLPLIITYNNCFVNNDLRCFLNGIWSELISSSILLTNVFSTESPQIVYKRGCTIGNLLISTKFNSILDNQDRENIAILNHLATLDESDSDDIFRVVPCNNIKCKCCQHILSTSSYFNSAKSTSYDILHNFNCASCNLIYIISCSKCSMLYVGQTSRALRERLNNHRSDIKLHKQTAISIHFNQSGHSLSDLIIFPIMDLTNISDICRIKLEYNLMVKLGTIYPKGLNCYPIIK